MARTRALRAGDARARGGGRDDGRERDSVVVVNRGVNHRLYSEHGVTFMEALAPVPLDHVPDKDVDLVLGPDGGATHVER
jgi:hypothetical protein